MRQFKLVEVEYGEDGQLIGWRGTYNRVEDARKLTAQEIIDGC